jgi:hypothetical protein
VGLGGIAGAQDGNQANTFDDLRCGFGHNLLDGAVGLANIDSGAKARVNLLHLWHD